MNLGKKLLYGHCTYKKGLSVFRNKSSCIFKHDTAKVFYSDMFNKKGVFNYKYYITKNTNIRINNMDLSKLKPHNYISLYNDKVENGFIIDDEDLQIGYSIRPTEIILLSGSGSNSLISRNYESSHGIYKMANGIIYFNYLNDDVSIIPTNPLSVLFGLVDFNNSNLDQFEQIFIKKEGRKFLEYSNSINNNIDILNIDYNTPLFDNYYNDFKVKYKNLVKSLKQFTFIKFANVLDKTFIADNTGLKHSDIIRGKKTNNSDIIKIDSFWNESIEVINPFSVSGHFRKQPIGKGRNDSKLIYIDSFMKTGYKRQAKILTKK